MKAFERKKISTRTIFWFIRLANPNIALLEKNFPSEFMIE